MMKCLVGVEAFRLNRKDIRDFDNSVSEEVIGLEPVNLKIQFVSVAAVFSVQC
jgi:hypothetical protein